LWIPKTSIITLLTLVTNVSVGAIGALDNLTNQNTLVCEDAGTRLTIVRSTACRVAIETLFAEFAVTSGCVVFALAYAGFGVAPSSMVVAFAWDAPT